MAPVGAAAAYAGDELLLRCVHVAEVAALRLGRVGDGHTDGDGGCVSDAGAVRHPPRRSSCVCACALFQGERHRHGMMLGFRARLVTGNGERVYASLLVGRAGVLG